MARSTTTRPQTPKTRRSGKPLHTRRDLSIKLRRSCVDPSYEKLEHARAVRAAIGFPDDWDPTDQAAAALVEMLDDMFVAEMEELREFELDLERRERERQAFEDLMDLEDSLERPCTCIGPCFYGSALHPTKKEKELFAAAIKETDTPKAAPMSDKEHEMRSHIMMPSVVHKPRPREDKGPNPYRTPRLNQGVGLRQFAGADAEATGYVRTGRARIVTGGSV